MEPSLYERNSLSLFLVEFVLFGTAACLATHQAIHAFGRFNQHNVYMCTGSRTRPIFLSLVAASLVTRLVFLCLSFFYKTTGGFAVWLRVFCRTFPALVYFSAYSVIVAFWADTYFRSRLVDMPVMVLSSLFYVNIALYSGYLSVAVVTLLHQSYFSFRRVAMLFVGVGSLVVAAFWLIFGVRVKSQLGPAVTSGRSRNISLRMLLLCIICPSLLILQGVYNVLVCLNVVHRYYPLSGEMRAWWDAVVFLTCEWVPCIVIVFVFWSGSSKRYPIVAPPQLMRHVEHSEVFKYQQRLEMVP
ncbi:MAG: hypothetical protein KVP17_002946 [Porospora cf. gigantea B]|uniref:uncharacterized protein n=1 Tax=Porospora cf. gigantea B TaxID=2853592 RepID=UPI0035718F1C|nr:MAG: hypothetical protein KVP17_002946 [Porospora cf. gigantea B]